MLKTFQIATLFYDLCHLTTVMSWRPFGASNNDLVYNLKMSGILRSKEAVKAFLHVDRGNFSTDMPYFDSPQPLGYGQTISAPHMHAYAIEFLLPNMLKEGAHILDVGCGSGYLSCVMARLNDKAKVYAIDCVPPLVELSKANTRKGDKDLLESGRLLFETGDGWLGYSKGAPYDAIHVGAGATSMPEELVKQLKVGGKMFIPLGDHSLSQVITLVTRTKETGPISESYTETELMPVRYVPLVKTPSPPESPTDL